MSSVKIGFFIFALLVADQHSARAGRRLDKSGAFLRGYGGANRRPAIPAGIKASAEWFPTKERGIAGACLISVLHVGAMLAPPLRWSGRC